MTYTYVVITKRYGEIRKLDDCIADARRWAKALGEPDVVVVRETRRCGRCDSRPCCCPRRRIA